MEVDYVIVGAGSAGCVVAERLGRQPGSRVLVLEAGPQDSSFWIRMPLGYGKLFYDRRFNWSYTARPDPGLNGRKDYWPRGRVVGGSSSINAMVYIKGDAHGYAQWQQATNDAGWGPESMAAQLRQIERFEQGGNEWRGDRGLLPAHSIQDEAHPLTQAFLDGCAALGLPRNADFNGASQEGVGLYQVNTRHGKRVSAADAFLRPAQTRGNVTLITGAQVLGLIFDGRRCIGVRYQRGGMIETQYAGAEVILAAGAVESPKLLQLSGIGPAALLQRHGIPLLYDNPNVGDHLQDHLGVGYNYRSKLPTLNQELAPLLRRLFNGARYLLTGRGPLALSVNQVGGFFRSSPARNWPNIQLYMQLLTTLEAKKGSRPLLTPDPLPALSLAVTNAHPRSRGSIMIDSADALAPPAIRPNAYDVPEDLEEMLEAVKFIRRLAATPPMRAILGEELRPGPHCSTDDELRNDIRERSATVYHPCGTCAMGADPQRSVLDADLRVRGVSGLRVVDASAFPNILSGNINVPVMLLASLAAERILRTGRG
ncbi:GMC family oxidoreductase [Ferrovibrio sp.]|uniref:GMC family oxidoreductase n=1 Tax=Ferrovibrio sp. TaxID=1917215 RepID=UPI003D2B9DF7